MGANSILLVIFYSQSYRPIIRTYSSTCLDPIILLSTVVYVLLRAFSIIFCVTSSYEGYPPIKNTERSYETRQLDNDDRLLQSEIFVILFSEL